MGYYMSEYSQNFNHLIKIYIKCTIQNSQTSKLSGDDLFSALKTSWSFSNSDLGHLRHYSDSKHPPVPETLQSTSYSEPLPAVPNTTARSLHSNPLSNTPSEDCSETSASSKGSPETSSDSVLSELIL